MLYETNFEGYEQLNAKYRINKETGKVINKHNRFVKYVAAPKKRDYGFMKDNQKNTRKVQCKNTDTNEITIYRSLYACSKDIKVNAGMIKLCCDGKYQKAVSKDNITYSFTYTDQEPTKDVTRQLTLYDTLEDRKRAMLERAKVMNRQRLVCECGIEYTVGGKSQHLRSKRHTEHVKKQEDI